MGIGILYRGTKAKKQGLSQNRGKSVCIVVHKSSRQTLAVMFLSVYFLLILSINSLFTGYLFFPLVSEDIINLYHSKATPKIFRPVKAGGENFLKPRLDNDIYL